MRARSSTPQIWNNDKQAGGDGTAQAGPTAPARAPGAAGTWPRPTAWRWAHALRAALGAFSHQFGRELMRRALYGSMVGAVVVWLLVSTSLWRAAGATLAHAEAATAVALETLAARLLQRPVPTDVVIVAIDDEAYGQRFGGRSPLDRGALAAPCPAKP